MSSDTKITVTIPFLAVQWHTVLEILVSRFKLSFLDADRALHDLFKRYFRLLNLAWFRNRTLSADDNRIAAAICEVHGADAVVLTHDKRVALGPVRFDYSLTVAMTPRLSRRVDGAESEISAKIVLRGRGREISLRRARDVVIAQGLVLLTGVVSYVALGLMLLYGVSVLWLLHQSPAEIVIAGTQRLDIGVALLAVFVGGAGFFGRALSGLVRLVKSGLQTAPAR